VKPYERLAEAAAPDGTVLTLYRHDGAYLLRIDGIELMSTRRSQSEVQLAELACRGLADQPGVRVLVGGLGFGFTMRAALERLGPDAQVMVAEIVPEVIAWNRNPEYALSGAAMDDPRVHIHQGDVLPLLRAHPGVFDAIMLDVDNGAESLTTKGNAKLYNDNGIQVAMAALRPGGRVLYWSADADPAFAKALRRNGLTVTTEQSRAHGTKGAAHELIVGEKRR
jgi:spermidine synthase